MKTIVLTGGGTAGHVMPNIALLPDLKKYFERIYYLGGNGIEKEIANKNGIIFFETDVIKFDRSNILANIKIPIILKKGTNYAIEILKEIKPNVIFSKGGYASLPSCIAAKKLHIPVVCHESDYTIGLANKIISRFAQKTLTSFPETQGGIYVGNPIRKEFICSSESFFAPNFTIGKPIILICGGSSGATAINNVAYEILPILTSKYNVIHIAGKKGNFNIKYKNYYQCIYLDKFPAALKCSDIVICRSGANTLSEAASLGKKCITIPLPKGASRGDQLLNAESYANRGYCKILLQDKLNAKSLLNEIENIHTLNPPKLDVLQINEKVVKHIISAI